MLLGISLFCSSTVYAASVASEYQIKVAFLFNFLKFIDFTNSRAPNNNEWSLCVRGTPELVAQVKTLDGKSVKGRTVSTYELIDLAKSAECDVVFFGSGESALVPEVLRQRGDQSILLVGEDGDFIERGGAIAYYLSNNRVRFRINLRNAEQQKLLISSQLLKLASTED